MKVFKVKQDANFVLTQAYLVASSAHRTAPQPIDLLVALVIPSSDQGGDTPHVQTVLRRHGLDLESVRFAIKQIADTSDAGFTTDSADSNAPGDFTTVVEDAMQLARSQDSALASTGHLAVALVLANDRLVAEVLHLNGVHPSGLLTDLKKPKPQEN